MLRGFFCVFLLVKIRPISISAFAVESFQGQDTRPEDDLDGFVLMELRLSELFPPHSEIVISGVRGVNPEIGPRRPSGDVRAVFTRGTVFFPRRWFPADPTALLLMLQTKPDSSPGPSDIHSQTQFAVHCPTPM